MEKSVGVKEKICGAESKAKSNEIFDYVWSLSENKVSVESMIGCVTPVG